MSRAGDRQMHKDDMMLSKSLKHKISLSTKQRPRDQLDESSMIDSTNKLASRHKNLSLALSNTVNIQRRIDQQLDLSVRKLNLQPPEKDNSFRHSKVVEARRLNFEAFEGANFETNRNEHLKSEHTSVVLNKISSKLDNILKLNKEDPKQHKDESMHFEYGKMKNSSYMELSAKGSQLKLKPPVPPKEFTRPVWVSFGSRSRSKVSNGSNGSKEDKKSEDKPDMDSSGSISKRSGYRVRYLPGKTPPAHSKHILDNSCSQNVLAPLKDLNTSTGNVSVDRKRKFSVKIPNQLCQTTNSMKNTSFSLLQLLDGKVSSSRRKALRQSLSRARLGESGKENRKDLENLCDLTGRKQSVEDVHIERKGNNPKKKNFSKITAEKTFQLEEETDRKPVIVNSNRFETSTGNGLPSSTVKFDNPTFNTMSIQISKFELMDDIEAPRPTNNVAQFFNTNMPHRVSPIRKPQVNEKTRSPKKISSESAHRETDCECSEKFSKLRNLLKDAEINMFSKPIGEVVVHNPPSALVRLKIANKQASIRLLTLFVNRTVRGRKLSGMARIFNRYWQINKNSRKAIVVAR